MPAGPCRSSSQPHRKKEDSICEPRSRFVRRKSLACNGWNASPGGGREMRSVASDRRQTTKNTIPNQGSPPFTNLCVDGRSRNGPGPAVHFGTNMQQCNRPAGTVSLTGRRRARENRRHDALVHRGERGSARKELTRSTPEWDVASIWKLPGWNVVSWDTRLRCHP